MTKTSDIPKVELHLHLEGAAPPAFIRGLAQEKNIDISGIFNEAGGYKFEGFVPFLRTYEAACTVLQTPHDFYRLTKAVLEQSAARGVIYSETFVAQISVVGTMWALGKNTWQRCKKLQLKPRRKMGSFYEAF